MSYTKKPVSTDQSITITTAFGKRMPVTVVERHERNGVNMARIVLPSGIDAWVKPTSLKREVLQDASPLASFVERKPTVTEAGMYSLNGVIFKVQESKTSGHLYAKRLVDISGNRLNEDDRIFHWEFQYDQGAIRSLTDADRMSVEEARAFGIQYGVCCVCGITLKDAKSVANGIGPVCEKRV